MSVLVVLDASSDNDALLEHVGQSFEPSTPLRVIAVVPADHSDRAEHHHALRLDTNAALVRLAKIKLRGHFGFRRVKTSVEYGRLDEAVTAAAKRFNVTRIVLDAPVRRGLLTAFGVDSQYKRLCSASTIPVELFRAKSEASGIEHGVRNRGQRRVVIPVTRSQISLLSAGLFQLLTLDANVSMVVVGVIPPSVGTTMTEASPASFLKQLHGEAPMRELLASELRERVGSLAGKIRPDLDIYYDVIEGEHHAAVSTLGHDPATDLLVLPFSDANSFSGIHGILSPAAAIMSLPCSVLLLDARVMQSDIEQGWCKETPAPADNVVPFPF